MRGYIDMHLEKTKEHNINGNGIFGKVYKFWTNLLLSTKLITFLNLNELDN